MGKNRTGQGTQQASAPVVSDTQPVIADTATEPKVDEQNTESTPILEPEVTTETEAKVATVEQLEVDNTQQTPEDETIVVEESQAQHVVSEEVVTVRGVSVHGVSYPSIESAALALGISLEALQARLAATGEEYDGYRYTD